MKEKEGEEVVELDFKVPPGLTRTIYYFEINPARESRTEHQPTSQYGNLPSRVIGLDDKLYQIRNVYLFDSNGKAVKVEVVSTDQEDEESLNEYLAEDGYSDEEKEKLKRLDFIPTEEQRTIPLRPGDYEQVLYFLDKIDMGEYRPEWYL